MRLKHFLSVFLTLLTLSVGQMWGADELVYTLEPYNTGSDNTSTGYANAATALVDDIHWNVTGNTNQVPWRIGGNSISGVDRPLYSTDAIADNITKIEVVHGAASGITVNSMTVVVSQNSNFSNPVSTLTPTFEESNTVTINRPNGADWSNCYYKIIYNVTKSGTGNKFIAFTRAKFYAESAVARTVTLMDDTSHPLQEQSAGAGVTLPERAGCPLQNYTFAGWTATWTEEQASWTTTAPTIIPAGTYHPAADVSLYPVYTKSEEGEGTVFSNYTLVNGGSAISSGQYLISTGAFTLTTGRKNGTSTTQAGGTSVIPGSTEYSTYEVTITGNKDEFTILCSDGYYIGDGQSSTNLAFSTSTPSTNVYKWTYTATGIQNKNTTTRYIRANGTTDFRFYTTSNGTEAFLYKRNETSGSTTYYISVPNCCTSLGSINGSFFWTTHFCPVWPEKHRLKGYYTNLGITSVLYRIPHHLIYTTYISRDFE